MLGGSVIAGFGPEQPAHRSDRLQEQQPRQTDPGLMFISSPGRHDGVSSGYHNHPVRSHHTRPSVHHTHYGQAPGAVRLAAPLAMPAPEQTRTAFVCPADLYSFLLVFAVINPPQR